MIFVKSVYRCLKLVSLSLMSPILVFTSIKGSFIDKDTTNELNAVFFIGGNILALFAVRMWLRTLAYKGRDRDEIVRRINALLNKGHSKIVIETDDLREDIDIIMESNFLGTKYQVSVLTNEQYFFTEDDVVYNHEFRVTYIYELTSYTRSIAYTKIPVNVRDITDEFQMTAQALTQSEQHQLERLGKGEHRRDNRTISRFEREFKPPNQEKSEELNGFLVRAMQSEGVHMDG